MNNFSCIFHIRRIISKCNFFFGLVQHKFLFGFVQLKFIFGFVQLKFILGFVQRNFIFGLVNSRREKFLKCLYKKDGVETEIVTREPKYNIWPNTVWELRIETNLQNT